MKLLAVLPLFLFVFAMPVSAQSATKWYWAYIEGKQQVISYDVAGNTHTLLEGVRPSNLYRVDDQTAAVMIERQNEYSAYILTAENAYPVAKLYTADLSDDYYVQPSERVEALALMPPYILIWYHKYSPPFLFNRETQAVQTLKLEEWKNIRRSKDGRYLRYLVQTDEDKSLALHWHIAEYDILKGTTRIIFERDEKVPDRAKFINEICEPDTYGEKWFCEQSIGIYPKGEGLPQSKNEIILLDGQTKVVAENQHLKVGLNGDWFLLSSKDYYNDCDEQCTFEVTNYTTREKQKFDVSKMELPQGVKFALAYSEVLDNNHLQLVDLLQLTLYLFHVGSNTSRLAASGALLEKE